MGGYRRRFVRRSRCVPPLLRLLLSLERKADETRRRSPSHALTCTTVRSPSPSPTSLRHSPPLAPRLTGTPFSAPFLSARPPPPPPARAPSPPRTALPCPPAPPPLSPRSSLSPLKPPRRPSSRRTRGRSEGGGGVMVLPAWEVTAKARTEGSSRPSDRRCTPTRASKPRLTSTRRPVLRRARRLKDEGGGGPECPGARASLCTPFPFPPRLSSPSILARERFVALLCSFPLSHPRYSLSCLPPHQASDTPLLHYSLCSFLSLDLPFPSSITPPSLPLHFSSTRSRSARPCVPSSP